MINLHYAHECPNIPELCSLASYNSRIILIKIETYYSQNYAGTLGSSLVVDTRLISDNLAMYGTLTNVSYGVMANDETN